MVARRFPKELRLRKRAEFIAVQNAGFATRGRCFVVAANKTAEGRGRLGITVSKKVGNAVVRNRIKRHVREFFRQERRAKGGWIPSDRDAVVIARAHARDADFVAVTRELRELGERLW